MMIVYIKAQVSTFSHGGTTLGPTWVPMAIQVSQAWCREKLLWESTWPVVLLYCWPRGLLERYCRGGCMFSFLSTPLVSPVLEMLMLISRSKGDTGNLRSPRYLSCLVHTSTVLTAELNTHHKQNKDPLKCFKQYEVFLCILFVFLVSWSCIEKKHPGIWVAGTWGGSSVNSQTSATAVWIRELRAALSRSALRTQADQRNVRSPRWDCVDSFGWSLEEVPRVKVSLGGTSKRLRWIAILIYDENRGPSNPSLIL